MGEILLTNGSYDFKGYIEDENMPLPDRMFESRQEVATYLKEGIKAANAKMMGIETKYNHEALSLQHLMGSAFASILLVISHPYPCFGDQAAGIELIVPASLVQICKNAVSTLHNVEETVDSQIRASSGKISLLREGLAWFFLSAALTGSAVAGSKKYSRSETLVETVVFLAGCFFTIFMTVGEKFVFNRYAKKRQWWSDFTLLKRAITITLYCVEVALVQQYLNLVEPQP